MGYYIHTTDGDFFLAKENFAAAYKAMCDLNQHDELKGGGSYGGEISGRDPRPAGMSYHPAKWFSWMDADYPSKCTTVHDILRELGFDIDEDDDGNIVGLSYSSKIGDEKLFLDAIAGLVRAGSYIDWQGEEGEHFRYEFDGSTGLIERYGRVVFD